MRSEVDILNVALIDGFRAAEQMLDPSDQYALDDFSADGPDRPVSLHARACKDTLLSLSPGISVSHYSVPHPLHRQPQLQDMVPLFAKLAASATSVGIRLVCVPQSDGSNRRNDDALQSLELSDAIARLRQQGILTVAAAGNYFRAGRRRLCQGMGAPAILRNVISVGAHSEGALTRHTQRLALPGPCRTTVFAPAAPPGGTSGAAAYVTGRLAAAVMSGATGEQALEQMLASASHRTDCQGTDWPMIG